MYTPFFMQKSAENSYFLIYYIMCFYDYHNFFLF